jgi:hypothetical protein
MLMLCIWAVAARPVTGSTTPCGGVVREFGDGPVECPADVWAIATAGGEGFSLALREDGTVIGWGVNDYGQAAPPPWLEDAVEVAAGRKFAMARLSGGGVACWGGNLAGECDVPSDLGPATAIAAGRLHALALAGDGHIAAWGSDQHGQCQVPLDSGPFQAIAAGWWHTLAVTLDGAVVAWGRQSEGQCSVPPDLGPVIAIAGGGGHSMALLADGRVRCWGLDSDGQCTVPEGLNDVVAIAAGGYHSVAVRSNGVIVAWGRASVCNSLPAGAVADALSCGDQHVTVITGDCDSNGVPDCLDLDQNPDRDCDRNGRPDRCERMRYFQSVEQSPLDGGGTLLFGFDGLPSAIGVVEVKVVARGDLGGAEQAVLVRINGEAIGMVFETPETSSDCSVATTDSIVMAAEVFNALGTAFEAIVELESTSSVGECLHSYASVAIEIETVEDCDGNGIWDPCQIASDPLSDCNGNGVIDACEGVGSIFEDCDSSGVGDECEIDAEPNRDCNGNGTLDACESWFQDCDSDGIDDACAVSEDSTLDGNMNGVPDSCECRCDLNGDELVNGVDLTALLAEWGFADGPIRPSDFDLDGVVGGSDLATLLGQWGTCP